MSGTALHGQVVAEIMTEFAQAFTAARTSWNRYAKEVHPKLGGAGLIILQTIVRRQPITATELCGLLDMDKAMMSRQITQLRDLDLVCADESDVDRRVMLLRGSAPAQAAMAQIQAHRAAEHRTRFAAWSVAELRELRQLLRRVNSTPSDTDQANLPSNLEARVGVQAVERDVDHGKIKHDR